MPEQLSASKGFGGGKPWIARLNGRNAKFGYDREFLAGRVEGSRTGKTGSLDITVTEPGLYECHSTGSSKQEESKFYVVLPLPDNPDELFKIRLLEATAAEIAQQLDRGRKVTDLRPETRESAWKIRDVNGKILWANVKEEVKVQAAAVRESVFNLVEIALRGLSIVSVVAKTRRRQEWSVMNENGEVYEILVKYKGKPKVEEQAQQPASAPPVTQLPDDQPVAH